MNGAAGVVVNPTHYSVALAYDDDGPIVESPPLARALHASVEGNDMIPESFFEAVAIVLAFVMRPRANKTASATRRVHVPLSKLPTTATGVAS